MCCHRHSGLGLIVLGLLICAGSATCYFHRDAHHARFERHVAEVCLEAAKQVQK